MDWQLAEAKNKLSAVVNLALSEGPQRIFRRKDEVVVIAANDYARLTGAQSDLKSFLLAKGPTLENVSLERDASIMRDVEL